MQATSTAKVKSFTIGFGEASHDESGNAEAVARHLGTTLASLSGQEEGRGGESLIRDGKWASWPTTSSGVAVQVLAEGRPLRDAVDAPHPAADTAGDGRIVRRPATTGRETWRLIGTKLQPVQTAGAGLDLRRVSKFLRVAGLLGLLVVAGATIWLFGIDELKVAGGLPIPASPLASRR